GSCSNASRNSSSVRSLPIRISTLCCVMSAAPHCACATLFDAAGNLSTIAATVFLSSCSYCASLSETAATPWPRHNKSLVLGSITSTITVPWVYCVTTGPLWIPQSPPQPRPQRRPQPLHQRGCHPYP